MSQLISYYISGGDLAVIEIDGACENHAVHIGQYGSLCFAFSEPCAVIQTTSDAVPVIARLCICQNYQARPTLGATVHHELHRDVLGVRWPTEADWANYQAGLPIA